MTADRKAVLGLVTLSDAAPARTRAATRLRDALTRYQESGDRLHVLLGRSDAPLTDDRVSSAQHAAVVAVKSAEAQVHELRETGRDLPNRRVLERQIGELTGTLSSQDLRTLRSFATDAQENVAHTLRDAVRAIARDRHRDLGLGL